MIGGSVLPSSMRLWIGVAGSLILLSGCAKDDGRLKAYPVHGKVTVDGQPAKGVFVFLTPAKQPATHAIIPMGVSDDQGEYWISTYDSGDGAPLGDYMVTSKWPKASGMQAVQSDSPDSLGDRYSDPAKSSIKLTVQEATQAKPNEIAPLELTSK